ncbi:sugar porter family MFS transporter, partial [Aureobasidium melanogenum]
MKDPEVSATSVPSTPEMMAKVEVPLSKAPEALLQQHDLTVSKAVFLYKKAIFWSIVMSTSIIMEGYDTLLIGSFFGQPAFAEKYGHLTKKHGHQISAPWQSGLNIGSTCGQLAGLLLAGYASERFGFRRTMMAGLLSITGVIFIQFFAPNLAVFEVAQILIGIPLGIFQTTAVVYAHEVAPTPLQGFLTAIGHFIGAGVLRGSLQLKGEWAYKIPFAIQWIWPVMLLPLIFLAPESPWWLVRKARIDEARSMQQRLMSSEMTSENVNRDVNMIVYTTDLEREIQSKSSYLACFKGQDLQRTLVVIGIYCTQTMCGNPLRSSSTYFLEQAGLPTAQSFDMTMISYALAVLGGIASWAMLPFYGRRTVYFWSLVMMLVLLIIIGALGVEDNHTSNRAIPRAIGSILIISSFLYNAAMGPLTNTLCVSIPSSLLRSKSVALARWFYAATGIAAGIMQPYMNNPEAWNWGAKSGFFWAGACLLSVIFAYFFVPETKDRTTAEIDLLYERGISARYSKNATLIELDD